MADKKISALTGASTPLAGTEVLPIVQGGATVKVAVSDLTVGRAVSALSLASTTGATFATTSGSVGIGTASPTEQLSITGNMAFQAAQNFIYNNTGSVIAAGFNLNGTNSAVYVYAGNTTVATFANPNLTLNTGNLIQGAAAKGINFTANTPAAGMTSQLLNWYEEGTWTPSLLFGGGNTGMTYTVQSGNYVRMGKLVYVVTRILLSAVGSSTGTATVAGLPFTSGATGTNYGSGGSVFSANMAGAAIGTQFGFQGAVSSTSVSLIQGNAVLGWSSMSQGNFTNTSEFDFNFTYICA